MQHWLASLDTDHVKDYVFATGRLREIRGASAALDQLNRSETEIRIAAHRGKKIYTGGGSVMARFDSPNDAHAFCEEIKHLYPTETGMATITGVVVAYDSDVSDGPGSFAAAIKEAARELRRAKAAGRCPPAMLSQPLWSRCQRCGHYPAIHPVTAGGVIGLCDSCQYKWQQERVKTIGPLHRLRQAAPTMPQADPPEELNDLGSLSKPDNYIGFIYADGNGIGRIIEDQMKTESDLRSFSKILEKSILAAIEDATRPFWPTNPSAPLPFLPVLVGGDDIILITTAQSAVMIANRLCLRFQEEVRDRSRRKKEKGKLNFSGDELNIAMSAGVAIAKSSHPIFALEELAGELLNSAKKLSSSLYPEFGRVSTLDFRVITTPTANPWELVREREFRLPQLHQRNMERWATCRPYTCQQLNDLNRPSVDRLIAAVQTLRTSGFPRNKLHAWRELLWAESETQIMLDLAYIQSRLGTEDWETLESIASLMGLDPGVPLYLTNPLNSMQALSPLPDLTELYEFIPEAL